MNGVQIGLHLQNKERKRQIDKNLTQWNNIQRKLSSEVCYIFFANNILCWIQAEEPILDLEVAICIHFITYI